ncbi:hypothetical protein PTKU46_52760 [Paraburkholderia terrae]
MLYSRQWDVPVPGACEYGRVGSRLDGIAMLGKTVSADDGRRVRTAAALDQRRQWETGRVMG